MSYDPTSSALLPEGRVEEPDRPCDTGEERWTDRARASEREYTEWLEKRRRAWRERAKETTG